MKALTRWIIRRLVPDYQNKDSIEVRARYGAIEAWVSIVVNIVLFLVKGYVGVMISSVAVIADAIHTLSDTATSLVILIGFKFAKRPADRKHPYGHQRAESVTALIVAVLLIVAGVELLRVAGTRFFDPAVKVDSIGWLVVVVLGATIVVKELLARFARELARMIDSKTLKADYWHHRSDALSTALVLVAIVGTHFGYARIDGVAGIAVGLIVIYSGYAIGRDAISPLLGESPSGELLRQIETAAHDVTGVTGVHDVLVHRYGRVNFVSLHVEALATQTAVALHDISERVEEAIERKMGGLAVVHADPLNIDHPRYDEMHRAVMKEVMDDERIANFHDLRILTRDEGLVASFDIALEKEVSADLSESIQESLRAGLASRLPGVEVEIKVEPYPA